MISSVTTNAAELVMLEMSLAMLFVTCVEIRAEILEHLNHGLNKTTLLQSMNLLTQCV